MPKITFEESEQYNQGSSFFGLADDGDTAQVNFLIDNERDIEVYATHKIEVDGSQQTVNCLREPGAPINDCPLCSAKHGVSIGVYVKLLHDGKLKIWTRGKRFYERIKNLCRRYKPLASHLIEIERSGKKGDQNTTYDFYDIADGFDKSIKSKDDLLADFSDEEIKSIEIFGNIIKDYSFEQLEEYLDTGTISQEGDKQVVRRNRKYDRDATGEAPQVERRVAKKRNIDGDDATPPKKTRESIASDTDEEEEVY